MKREMGDGTRTPQEWLDILRRVMEENRVEKLTEGIWSQEIRAEVPAYRGIRGETSQIEAIFSASVIGRSVHSKGLLRLAD